MSAKQVPTWAKSTVWTVCLASSIVFYGIISLQTPSPDACIDMVFPNLLGRPVVQFERRNSFDYFSQGSIYDGEPTATREKAWDVMCPYGVVELDTPPSTTAQVWPELPKEILAVPGFSIQMNCLKQIRRFIYDDQDFQLYVPPSRHTVDQCIEKLRQDLLCTFEGTPFLQVNTDKVNKGVSPSVWTAHVCRDYDRVARWATENFVAGSSTMHDFIELDL